MRNYVWASLLSATLGAGIVLVAYGVAHDTWWALLSGGCVIGFYVSATRWWHQA